MMGRQVEKAPLFSNFSLEAPVPAGHPVRSLDRFVDFRDIDKVAGRDEDRVGAAGTGAQGGADSLALVNQRAEAALRRHQRPSC